MQTSVQVRVFYMLHIQMRSTNGYVWSEWSESEIIALDMNCSSTHYKDESKSLKQLIDEISAVAHVLCISVQQGYFVRK